MATTPIRRPARTRALIQLEELVLGALTDMKAVNLRVLDVRGLTDVADTMIVASGNSDRHVRSISDRVIERAKQSGHQPIGTEGKNDAEWVLVDLRDVLVHVMLPRVREFYALEQLWEAPAVSRLPVQRPVKTRTKGATKVSSRARGQSSGKAATATRRAVKVRPRSRKPKTR
jgi:ribosome-associated protein